MLLLISIGALLASCHHVYYAPNTPHAPQLSEKGQTRINALYASGGDTEYDGFELQFAHAISKKAGIMLNGFTAGKSENITDYSGGGSHLEKGKGSYVELAGGMFTTVDPKKKWVADMYGGIGFGGVTNEYGYGDRSKTGITKFFLQPSFGYKGKHFEFALVPRLSLVNWKIKTAAVNSPESEEARNDISIIRSDPSFIAFEPALIIRVGAQNMKLQGALAFSDFRSGGMYYTEGLGESLNASLGVSIYLNGKKK